MGKSVTGFLANDGSFHETEAQADFRDAEEEIRNWCVTHTPNAVDDNALLEYVEALADPISRYLNAKDRIDVEATREEIVSSVGSIDRTSSEQWPITEFANYLASLPDVESNQADNTTTEEDITPLFKQPIDRCEPMPNLGGSTSAESIHNEHPSDGTGSRKRNARNIRGSSYLATDDEAGS